MAINSDVQTCQYPVMCRHGNEQYHADGKLNMMCRHGNEQHHEDGELNMMCRHGNKPTYTDGTWTVTTVQNVCISKDAAKLVNINERYNNYYCKKNVVFFFFLVLSSKRNQKKWNGYSWAHISSYCFHWNNIFNSSETTMHMDELTSKLSPKSSTKSRPLGRKGTSSTYW